MEKPRAGELGIDMLYKYLQTSGKIHKIRYLLCQGRAGFLQVSPQLVLRLQWMNIFSSFSSSKAQVILVHPASASPPLILQLSHRVKYISNISLFWRKHKMYEIHKWWEKWKYQSTSGKKQKFRAPLLCCDCGQFMVHIGRMIYGCWEYSDAQPIQDCKPVSVQPACSCWWKINCMNGKISEKGKIMGRKVLECASPAIHHTLC